MHCEVRPGRDTSGAPGAVSGFLDGLGRAVEHVKHGTVFLDTADSYGCGHSERMIGRFVRERQDVPLYLSSKVGRVRGSAPHPFADRHIHHQFEQSLENLYAEQLDLYTLESFDFGPADRYLGNAIDAMRTLRELESIKAIGMRGPYADYGSSPAEWEAQAERFLYLFRLIKPDVVWTRFNAFTPAVLLDGEDLFSFTARHGVGLVLAAPLAHGVLTGAGGRTGRSPSHLHRTASQGLARSTPLLTKRIAEGLQRLRNTFDSAPGTLTRLALRSCLQRGDNCVVVMGFSNGEQVEENYTCLGPALTEHELAVVDEIYEHLRDGLQVDATRRVAEGAHI
ncbi:aldo/keto reductase [Streptomyces sp. NPDC056160]|uniref:aldo/keto reductase n=1 Tax=Streptomyces sp. NPDC056160 TaxID=3345731 RepID=UPI0035DDB69A